MKIVSRQEFLSFPSGTVFSFYETCIIRGLMVKHETIYHNGIASDFTYQDLIGNIDNDGSDDYFEKLLEAPKNKTDLKLDFECIQRDGLFEQDSMYAVYTLEDVQGLISCLSKAIEKQNPDHS